MLRKNLLISFVSLIVVFASQPLVADEALARSKNCLACHGIDNKIVGPAFKDVAAKYKGDANGDDDTDKIHGQQSRGSKAHETSQERLGGDEQTDQQNVNR